MVLTCQEKTVSLIYKRKQIKILIPPFPPMRMAKISALGLTVLARPRETGTSCIPGECTVVQPQGKEIAWTFEHSNLMTHLHKYEPPRTPDHPLWRFIYHSKQWRGSKARPRELRHSAEALAQSHSPLTSSMLSPVCTQQSLSPSHPPTVTRCVTSSSNATYQVCFIFTSSGDTCLGLR